MKAETIAGAPALPVLKEIRRVTAAVPPHLAQGNALLCRWLDLQKRTPGDVGIIWAAARLLTADAALSRQMDKAIRRSQHEAIRIRLQRLEAKIAELNSPFASPAAGDSR